MLSITSSYLFFTPLFGGNKMNMTFLQKSFFVPSLREDENKYILLKRSVVESASYQLQHFNSLNRVQKKTWKLKIVALSSSPLFINVHYFEHKWNFPGSQFLVLIPVMFFSVVLEIYFFIIIMKNSGNPLSRNNQNVEIISRVFYHTFLLSSNRMLIAIKNYVEEK